jgi:hypothetical protein
MATTIKNSIYSYIIENFKPTDPIVQTELYDFLKLFKPITIRQTLRRLAQDEKIIKSEKIPGVYFLPDLNRVLSTHTLNFSKYIEQKYLKDDQGKVLGYESGFTIANRLGLTTQMPSVNYIYSNSLADKKREVKINNRRFIINAPRVTVTTENYRLLQVLDIISNFERYSEYKIQDARNIFKEYLSDLSLNKTEIEDILNHYPIKTQLNFYKMGVDHVIAFR